MAPKQILEKNAWLWAEHTDPSCISWDNIKTAYRTILPQCSLNPCACRKNCMGNPNCYNGLGERTWMEKNLDEEMKEAENESSKGGKRTPGSFIGLKNLGATCYANTFLQVWFHNPEFRQEILEWSDEENSLLNSSVDCTEVPGEHSVSSTSENSSSRKRALEQLQLLFALLCFSNRKYMDPSSFIKCLQLDTSTQQDAQEFSKLFISVLEELLPSRECYQGLNLIQHQFVGHYEYVTRCNGCGQQSRSRSKFYEIDLNIKGHTNLGDCMQEFLQEEQLDGENQYHCAFCQRKQDAVRRIHLLDLPPTLNFQLLRFIFDRQTQNKKKLMSYLQFPETLDMNEYMSHSGSSSEGNREDLVYDLVSVLIHRGPGAHSGHYIAVIKDCITQTTYRFNDEEVEKLADGRFRLEAEEDSDGNKTSQKKPRNTKGYLCSKNAYMLVYRRRNTGTGQSSPEITLGSLSPSLREMVENDNRAHEESLHEELETKKFFLSKERERQDLVKQFYNILQAAQNSERNDSYDWISASWLKEWLSAVDSMGTVPPIKNEHLLCPHDKIHPEKVSEAKLIPSAAVDLIIEKYGDCLRLPCYRSICRQCVEEKCRVIHTKAMIAEDNKLIGLMLKSKDSFQDCDDSFWVGKLSLKNWRQMAEELFHLSTSQKENGEQETETDDAKETPAKDMGDVPVKEGQSVTSCSNSKTELIRSNSCDAAEVMQSATCSMDVSQEPGVGDANSESDNWSFNEDLLCSVHSNLSPDMSKRRLIPRDIWILLRKYFPTAPEFRSNAPECHYCKTQSEQERLFKEQDKATAAEQRLKLMDLFQDRKRPTWTLPDVTCLNVITSRFIEEWRRHVRDPLKHTGVPMTDNVSLLCNHGRFMFDVEKCEFLNDKYVYVWPHEWNILTNYFKGDIEITVTKCHDPSNRLQLVVNPEFCQKCCHERQEEEYSLQFTYTNETIYVRKVTDETRALFTRTLNSKLSAASDGETGTTDESDDIEVWNENGKRAKSNGVTGDKVMRLELPSSLAPVRRSTRQGRIHNEMKFEVSSSLTLRDLKLLLVKPFSVMKMDQHLFLDGVELLDENATLKQLKVRPSSILYLQADEPSGETTFMDVAPVASVEEGFKGTSLVGR